MFFVAALVICLVIKFRFPKGKSIARSIKIVFVGSGRKSKYRLSFNYY